MQNGWFHPWVASTNPDLGEYSPGQTFLMRAIAAMPGLGLTTYDLGPSHDHYKRHYAAPSQTGRGGDGGRVDPRRTAWRGAASGPGPWRAAAARGMVASLRRRLDAIAVTELSTVRPGAGLRRGGRGPAAPSPGPGGGRIGGQWGATVSIVIPTQRRPAGLAVALRSALAQTGVDPRTGSN
jgi:hypothetical protein